MPKRNEYTFVVTTPPSEATVERMARFLTETLAKYKGIQVSGTVRRLAPEEVGKCPAVDFSRLSAEKEAS